MRLKGIGILASLAMIMAFAAAPVAANHGPQHGEGEADCPANTLFIDNLNQSELVVGLELTEDVVITAVTTDGSGQVTSVTIDNNSDQNVTIAVKGGSNQAGNFVTIAPGSAPVTITVTDNPTISNLSVCAGPVTPTPTLSLEKVITGGAAGDDEIDFDFTLSGAASGTFTTDANDPALLLASASGTFTITEGAESGWTLNNIACTGGTDVSTTATSITVTVGTDADVVCTFTNGKVTTVVTQSLVLEKVVSSGNANTEFAFSFGASGTIPAALANTVSANDAAVVLSTTAGSYVIAESALAGWNLTGINCVGNAADETASVSIANRQVTIVVGAGENVTCTFTNAPTGTLTGNPVVRTGTLASVPNTATDAPLNDGMPTVLVTVLALAGLAYAGHRNLVSMRARR